MFDKEKYYCMFLVLGLVAVIFFCLSGGGDNTGTNGGINDPFERLGKQQRRTEDIAYGIDRGLEYSRGTVNEIEQSNTTAAGINKNIASAVERAVGRVGSIEGLLADSEYRIKACQRVISEISKEAKDGTETK